MKCERYEQMIPTDIIRRQYQVHKVHEITDYKKIIPKGFQPGGKRCRGMWRSERKYSYNHAKTYDVDRVELCTIPMAFDIETTTIKDIYGYMYHWQFAIGDHIILGRTWKEFDIFIGQLIEILGLGVREMRDRQANKMKSTMFECRVWVANLGFEFQFLRLRYKVLNVFAKTTREPLTAIFENGIFMQDALAITNSNLASIPKLYKLPTPKMVGDLDYTKIRNSLTELTPKELEYCINDVKILVEFGDWLNTNYVENGLDIPYTKTGILRDTVKKNFKAWINSVDGKDKKGNARKYADSKKVRWITSLFPETYAEFYNMQRFLFRGGYTHGNSLHVFEKLYNVNGVDFTSSYPAVMLQCEYPITKFYDCEEQLTVDEIIENTSKGYATKCRCRFYELHNLTTHAIESISKTEEYDRLKSLTKCRKEYGMICDNGRIVYADVMTVWLTDIDLAIYRKFYGWKNVEITEIKIARYGKLPGYLLNAVKYYYSLKAELKKAGLDGTTRYKIAKAMVNAAYGMMCEHLHLLSVEYINDEWIPEERVLNPDELQEQYIEEIFGKHPEEVFEGKKAPSKFLSIYWGIWVTAHARKRLLDMVYEIGDDVVYCDTDSIYMINYYKHSDKILKWNYHVYEINKQWVTEHNAKREFDENRYKMLKNTGHGEYAHDWKEKSGGLLTESFIDLGEFDKLNKMSNYIFKQGGAKRYIKMSRVKDKETGKIVIEHEQTIAGLPKTAYLKDWKAKHYDYFDYFEEDGFCIENCKNAHAYNDEYHEDIVTDEDGNTETMCEYSSIGIFPIDFSLKIDERFLEIIELYAENRKPINFATGERF